MKRRLTATFLVFTMMIQLVMPALGQIGSPPPVPPPDGVSDRFDVGSVLANPTLFYILQTDEEKNPEKAFVRVDNLRFQGNLDTSGSLTKVAQYQPLDTGAKMKNLFYQRESNTRLFQLLASYDGYSSARLEAALNSPSRYHLKVFNVDVFHRLENPTKIDFTLTPDATYNRTWSRWKVDGDLSVTKGGEASVYGGLQTDKRVGVQGHTFFQLHRFNCTDCHTLGFGRGVAFRTDDWWAGARGRLPWQGGVVDAQFRSSQFKNEGTTYTYNFGGPWPNSTLYPTSGTNDRKAEYQAYFGPGDAPWRAGAHVVTLDRNNTATGQTRNSSYVSVQAGGHVGTDLTLTGSYYSQSYDNSISTNLSSDREKLTLQAAWTPLKTLVVSGRLGVEDRTYKINGGSAPTMHDAWFELRGDWRPTKQWHVIGSYRNDNTDHPYFQTDLARRQAYNAQVTYTTGEVTSGLQWSSLYGSNTINDFRQNDFLAFVTARMMKKYLLSASFADTSVNSNVAQNYFLPMPTATAAAISPGIGGPLFLQSGLPYAAHNQYFQAGLTIPIGTKYTVNFTPTYRWVRTDTNANYLPLFPAVPADSQVHIIQNIFGLKLDAPVWGPDQRLGVGWEHDSWSDRQNASNSGTFDIFMINFTKRF